MSCPVLSCPDMSRLLLTHTVQYCIACLIFLRSIELGTTVHTIHPLMSFHFPISPNPLPSSPLSPPFISATSLLHSMYANPDVWCCLLSGQASSGSHLVDCDPIEEGGVIGCHINSNDGTVTFYRNDEFLLQFDNLNDHPAMRTSNGSSGGSGSGGGGGVDALDPMSRGVRPFVCLEVGGDSITYMGPKCDEAIVTFPESDLKNRFSFSGRIVNGNFDGLCEQHLWGQDGRWMGYYVDGLREGTHVCVTAKKVPGRGPSDVAIAEDFIPEKSSRSAELDDLNLKSLENEMNNDVKFPSTESNSTNTAMNTPVNESGSDVDNKEKVKIKMKVKTSVKTKIKTKIKLKMKKFLDLSQTLQFHSLLLLYL
jgi:hypothetical protein